MNQDPAKLSLSNFLADETSDPLEPPSELHALDATGASWRWSFMNLSCSPVLMRARPSITTANRDRSSIFVPTIISAWQIILKCIAAAQEALKTHGLGACGSPMLSGMTDLHRELERQVAKFLGREDAMLFNSGFGGALGTISGLLRKNDVAILDNRSHLESARWRGAVAMSRGQIRA